MKVKLLISYDGTDFGGWQKQRSGKPTVQGTLESALKKLFKRDLKTLGAGRTDAGVHASGQVCHFAIEGEDPTRFNLTRSLNTFTPDTLAVQQAWLAPDDFSALHSATAKTYKYLIHNSKVPDALRARYSLWVRHPLELDLLNSYSQVIVGEHDFKSFQTKGTDVVTTTRTVIEAGWQEKDDGLLEFTITGTGFLKQMVRNIIGGQLDLHAEKAPAAEVKKIMAAKDRKASGGTAAAHGLYLHQVHYPESIDSQCQPI